MNPNWKEILVDLNSIEVGENKLILIDHEGDTTTIENVMHGNKEKILDNIARINNLEDKDLQKSFLEGLELSSIRKEFIISREIKVLHSRKFINNIIVYEDISTDPLHEKLIDITSAVEISNNISKSPNGDIIEKYILVESNRDITGYVIVI